LIEIISSSAEFESAVEKCLIAAEADRTARLNAMSRETWPQKVEQICEALS